jgi:hypothetical protein
MSVITELVAIEAKAGRASIRLPVGARVDAYCRNGKQWGFSFRYDSSAPVDKLAAQEFNYMMLPAGGATAPVAPSKLRYLGNNGKFSVFAIEDW